MEFFLFFWEKSERIELILFLTIMSSLATWLFHHEALMVANPNDLLAGTFIEPFHWVMKGMWFLTFAAVLLYIGRCIKLRLFEG